MRIEYLADNPSFISAIAHMHHGEWGSVNSDVSLESRIADLQNHLRRKKIPMTFISLFDGIFLGSISLVAHDMDTLMHLSPWLTGLYVVQGHRSRGVGTALVERVLLEAESIGVETLYLFTLDREYFFTRLGWFLVERTEYCGQKVIIMALNIADRNIAA